MGLFKLIGSVAAGVVTVATLPVSAPVAGIAGLAAAAAASSAMSDDEEGRRRAHKHGEQLGYERAKKEYEEALRYCCQQIDFVCGAVALGTIAAKADGTTTEEEVDEINVLVGNIDKQAYDDDVKNLINYIWDNYETFEDAKDMLDDVDADQLVVLDELIQNIIISDGEVAPEEKEIFNEWRNYLKWRCE